MKIIGKTNMKAKKFKESTVELKKPTSMTDEECESLFIHQTEDGQCISLWTAPFRQRLRFLFHGHLWLGVLSGNTQPPVWIDLTKNVFIKKEKRKWYITIDRPKMKALGGAFWPVMVVRKNQEDLPKTIEQ